MGVCWEDYDKPNLQKESPTKISNGKTQMPKILSLKVPSPEVPELKVVSIKEPKLYKPHPDVALKHPSGRTVRIVVLDVGMKFNQIRCFTKRGVELKVLPWNSQLPDPEPHDGLFISNGPGDPATLSATVEQLKSALHSAKTPIFGICLGHQLLSLAAGAKTEKMKFGNRGHNIPCTDLMSGRCYITSQNHGYAVVADSLPAPWKEFFVNANDGSNEGIYHSELPFFSVQFHPESTPGPRDTEFLFDVFVDVVKRSAEQGKLAHVIMPGANKPRITALTNGDVSDRVNVQKCLVLGSGGLSIGQAGEFDYSGSQVTPSGIDADIGNQSVERRRYLYHLNQSEYRYHPNLERSCRQSLFPTRYPRICPKGHQTRTPRFDICYLWWSNGLECRCTIER